jgi:hypothetical protein
MYLIADLTPASPGIAAALWASLVVAVLVIGSGLRRQRRGLGVRPRLVLIAIALLLGGLAFAWLMSAWLGEAALAYGGADGRPAAPVSTTVISSWPLVQSAAWAGVALGAIALLVMASTSVLHRRRTAPARGASLN